MNKFILSNALASLLINLAINIVIPLFILWNDTVVYLKEGSSVLLPNIVATVFISAFITCLVTFFLLTAKRKKGDVELPINPQTKWFPKALAEGLLISAALTAIALGVLFGIQSIAGNIEIAKTTVLLITGITGAVTGFITSFIAINRASKIGTAITNKISG